MIYFFASATSGCDSKVSAMPMFVREYGFNEKILFQDNPYLFRRNGVRGVTLTMKPFTHNYKGL